MKDIDISQDREIQEFAQRLVDEALSIQGIMNYLFKNDETGHGLAELCDLIDIDYPELAERRGESAEIDSRLQDTEERMTFNIGVAVGRRLGNGTALESGKYRRTIATLGARAANVRVPAIRNPAPRTNTQKGLRTVKTAQKKASNKK